MERIILVPIDFSPASLRALEVAQDLARRMDATIALVQVREFPPTPDRNLPTDLVPRYFEEARAESNRSLELLAAACGGLRHEIRLGDPARKILETVREIVPELVVMGTHGRRGVSRLVLGSVAEKVIRESPVPVVTVRPPADTRRRRASRSTASGVR